MGWGLVFSGVSAAAGLFNAVDENRANRKIVADLDEIKKYLKDIKKSIQFVKLQNQEILSKLDDLPITVANIVETVVSTHLLEERYNDIDDIRDNFITLRQWRRVSIRGRAWSRFSNSMNYIFDHEHRISRLLDLISISELGLCITRNRAKSIVLMRLDDKIENLEILSETFREKIENQLDKLLIDLNNKKYIESHNLTPDLENLNNLVFNKSSNKTKTQYYNKSICKTYTRGSRSRGTDSEVTKCENKRMSRQVDDTQFHTLRDNYVKEINQTVVKIKKQIIEFGQLSSILNCLKRYRNDISKKAVINVLETEESLLFLDTDLSDKSNESHLISNSDLNTFLEIEDKEFEFKELKTENESFNIIIR